MMGMGSAVVRGLLSRTSAAPWSVFYVHPDDDPDERDPDAVPMLEVRDATQGLVATLPAEPAVLDNASLIVAAPTIATDYVSALTRMAQVNAELRQAGIEQPESRGVHELAQTVASLEGLLRDCAEDMDTLHAEIAGYVESVLASEEKFAGVRALIGKYGAAELDEQAAALYRDLVSAVMTSTPDRPEDSP